MAREKSEGSAKRASGPARAKRFGLPILGGLLIALVVVFAITRGDDGGGDPKSPAGYIAVVRDVPRDISHVTVAEFEKALEHQAASWELEETPEPGDPAYEEMKRRTINQLFAGVWIRGEAEELGISISDKQGESELAQVKKGYWPTEKAFQEFLQKVHYTPEEAKKMLEVKLLEKKIQQKVKNEASPPTEAEIVRYYKTKDKSQLRVPETRDVRMIANKHKKVIQRVKRALEEGHTPTDWKRLAKKYSTDPASKNKGGLHKNVVEEILPTHLLFAVEDARTGTLVGPIKSEGNWFELEVVNVKPVRVMTLAEARPSIRPLAKAKKRQDHYAKFATSYQSKWAARTHCEPDFLIESCGNYEDKSAPKASSGTVAPHKPKGESPPQRPAPPGLE